MALNTLEIVGMPDTTIISYEPDKNGGSDRYGKLSWFTRIKCTKPPVKLKSLILNF